MIDPKELRIGNYLKGNELSVPKLGLYHNGYIQITAYGINMIERYDTSLCPIPLTFEILEKFGFGGSSHSDRMFKPIENSLFTIYFEDDIVSIEDEDWSVTHLRRIKYLHQLQNLYFALTGAELIMNPEPKI